MSLDPAAADLHQLLHLGLERGGHLLTAGELHIVRRILTLPPDPARVYALLSARTHGCWPEARLDLTGVEAVDAALDTLRDAELIDHLVPWSERARRLPRKALAAAAERLGLDPRGRKAELVERLSGHTGWTQGRWVRIRHRALVRRLERWALMRKHPDRATLVVERLGHVRWPHYALTGGPTVHPSRRALLAWERLLADPEPEGWPRWTLGAIRAGHHRAPGRLDLTRRLRERLLDRARQLERAGDLEEARRLYLEVGALLGGAVAIRVARTLERQGRAAEALGCLQGARGGAEAIAVQRAGRRLARKLRRAWAPSPPLAAPPLRTVRLAPAPSDGPRPLYQVGAEAHPVEAATIASLQPLGRRALHAEGALWRTLAALLLADCYFLPIPGALPVRYLDGPLDLGTPAFRRRRAGAIDALLASLRAGEGPMRVAEADRRWRGVRLAGASFDCATADDLIAVAQGLGPAALSRLVGWLAEHGPAACAGLPDLVILPGAPVRLPDALPGHLPGGLLLAELKGPGDSLRDEQALWLDRLQRFGAPVELWEITPRPTTAVTPLSRSVVRPHPAPRDDPDDAGLPEAGTQLALLLSRTAASPLEEDHPCPEA